MTLLFEPGLSEAPRLEQGPLHLPTADPPAIAEGHRHRACGVRAQWRAEQGPVDGETQQVCSAHAQGGLSLLLSVLLSASIKQHRFTSQNGWV